MEAEEIHLGDWKRIFIGNAPPEFLLEVLLRSVFIYLALVVIVRLLGKRLNAQATLTEMALTITLGAIVGSPMQIPERGLLIGIFILILALIFQWFMGYLSFSDIKLETLTQGRISLLVKDGILNLKQMRRDRISRRQLYASLRARKIHHLGQVRRVYLEATGQFSVVKNSEKCPGLSVFPEDDNINAGAEKNGIFACAHCGNISNTQNDCSNCGRMEWVAAIE